MKVLMISRDETILKEGSISAGRMAEYGNLCKELHIIVFCRSGKTRMTTRKNAEKIQLSDKIFVYPTNSFFKLFSIFTAYRIGKKIIGNWKLEIGNCVVTTQDPFETGLVGFWLKRKFKIGLNIQAHGDFFGNPYFKTESFLNKIRFEMAAMVIKKADSIRAVSKRIKDSLISNIQFPISKIVIAPIFTDIQKIQATQPKFDLHERFPESNLILLWVGKMGKVKNLSFLLRAFKHVLEAFPKAILVLVGDGPDETKLKQEVKDLKIEASVKFEGEIPLNPPLKKGETEGDLKISPFKKGGGEEGDLISYYKTADIFVFPSLYEGWGRVIVEAAAAGLPIVMAEVGCANEVIKNGESGEVVAVNDTEGFVRSVTKLGFNPDLRQKYKDGALEALRSLPDKEKTVKLIKESWELVA